MIPKVKLIFDRKKQCTAKGGEGDVEIYVYHNGRKRYLSTGVRVRKREYKDGVISVRIDAVELNKRLQWCVQTIQEQVNAMVEKDMVALGDLRIDVTDRSDDFWQWAYDYVNEKRVSEGTRRNLIGMLNKVREASDIKEFADVTAQAIDRIDRNLGYLKESSRAAYHATFKSVVYHAYRLKKIASYPYECFTFHEKQSTRRIKYLGAEELAKLEAISGTLHKLLQKSLDIFLLGCYTGLRYSDISQLRRENMCVKNGIRWLTGEQQKTGNDYAIVASDKVVEILDRYDWDVSEHASQLNRRLKTIARIAGVREDITMHQSRHTFATKALGKGVRMEVVSKMLGHTDIKMTQRYAKVLNDEVAKGFEMIEGDEKKR